MNEPEERFWTRESTPALLFVGGLASVPIGFMAFLGLSFIDHASPVAVGLAYVALYGGIASTVVGLILNLATRTP
jgi:hypothetical protein